MFTDRFKNINKKNVYKIQRYMDVFQIKEIAFCEDSIKEMVISAYIRAALCAGGVKARTCSKKELCATDNTAKDILYVVSEDMLKLAGQNIRNAMSRLDFMNIFELEEGRLVPKTMVYNTLENCYSSLLVIGDGSFASDMKEYYSHNNCIDVRTAGNEVLMFDNGSYYIDIEPGQDELVMIMDPLPQFPVYYGKPGADNEANVFFVNNLFRSFYKPVETYKKDIDSILKTLQNNGVTVVTVCSANYSDFQNDKELVASIDAWNKLRHKDSEAFNIKRHEARGTAHLIENQKNLTHSYDKGYSQMHGNGEYINFLNGFRVTTGNMVGAANNIYIFGACVVRDLGADDDNTLASLIKKKVGDKYNVQNYGSEIHATNLIMRTLDYKPGDVVIWWSLDNIKKVKKLFDDSHYCDLTNAYRRVPELHKHVFDDINHYDRTVKNEVVEEIVNTVNAAVEHDKGDKTEAYPDVISFGKLPKRIPAKEFNTDSAFGQYLAELEGYIRPGKKGAIVMNCNPFTLGHRYLIETASKQVDNLYVFVVEEDKSVFKFKDRIEMVRRGTADLTNVMVLPSGRYFASAQTLPGYFKRADLKDTYLNANDDIELFVQTAAALGVSVRFVGEEPIDVYTSQYNENIKRILPRYGLEYVVIPRKTISAESDAVISASMVRKLINEKDYAGVKSIVPETTYNYLAEVLHMVEE